MAAQRQKFGEYEMTGIEVAAVAYLCTWAKHRAKPVTDRAGQELDRISLGLMDKLHQLVETKCQGIQSSLVRLDRDVAESRQNEPRDSTKSLLQSNLAAQIEDDATFARQLTEIVQRLESLGNPSRNNGNVYNTISGGTQHGPVIQGRDIQGFSFGSNSTSS
jgi:hypothetical protein